MSTAFYRPFVDFETMILPDAMDAYRAYREYAPRDIALSCEEFFCKARQNSRRRVRVSIAAEESKGLPFAIGRAIALETIDANKRKKVLIPSPDQIRSALTTQVAKDVYRTAKDGPVTPTELASALEITRQTAAHWLKTLTARGVLIEASRGSRFYYFPVIKPQ